MCRRDDLSTYNATSVDVICGNIFKVSIRLAPWAWSRVCSRVCARTHTDRRIVPANSWSNVQLLGQRDHRSSPPPSQASRNDIYHAELRSWRHTCSLSVIVCQCSKKVYPKSDKKFKQGACVDVPKWYQSRCFINKMFETEPYINCLTTLHTHSFFQHFSPTCAARFFSQSFVDYATTKIGRFFWPAGFVLVLQWFISYN